jgi:hypothetical protein
MHSTVSAANIPATSQPTSQPAQTHLHGHRPSHQPARRHQPHLHPPHLPQPQQRRKQRGRQPGGRDCIGADRDLQVGQVWEEGQVCEAGRGHEAAGEGQGAQGAERGQEAHAWVCGGGIEREGSKQGAHMHTKGAYAQGARANSCHRKRHGPPKHRAPRPHPKPTSVVQLRRGRRVQPARAPLLVVAGDRQAAVQPQALGLVPAVGAGREKIVQRGWGCSNAV